MTQEGLNELRNFLGRLTQIMAVLPELQKIADIETSVKEKQSLLNELQKQYLTALDSVAAAKDSQQEHEVRAKILMDEARSEAKKVIEAANSKAVQIVKEAREAEAHILDRVKKIQDNLAKL